MQAGIVIAAIALLTMFLVFSTSLKYVVHSTFERTRLVMTAFFVFIVTTLTLAFWPYALASLRYSIPAALAGALMGYIVGVREAERRIMMEGLNHYLEHFAHVHITDLKELRWWSIVNFYTVMAALILINFVGLSTVIFRGRESWALTTCAIGAFLLGSIVPYLVHLWGLTKDTDRAQSRHTTR
jgi:hypothetical protein